MCHFEVAIIGGGIYGCSVAYFLAEAGIRGVLLEQGTAGAQGATGYSGGILRVYDPDPYLTELSLAGVCAFRDWERLGYPGMTPYRGSGCLYRLAPANHGSALERLEKLRGRGYNYALLDGGDLSRQFPWLKVTPGDLAIWEPESGYGSPRLAARNLLEGSLAKGGTVIERCRVSAIDYVNHAWKISLECNVITATILVLAGGAFCRQLIPELPIVTRSIPLLHMFCEPKGRNPGVSVVDEVVDTYLRPCENDGYYCGSGVWRQTDLPEQLPEYGSNEYGDSLSRINALVKEEYQGVPLTGFRGFDAYTDNKRPLTEFLGGYEDLFVATGFSGRGFKYVLPLSRVIARQIGERLGRRDRSKAI